MVALILAICQQCSNLVRSIGIKKYSIYGLYRPGDSKPFYIGITDNIKTRTKQHRKSGRLVGTERLVELYSDLDYETARGYEEGCIR